MPTNPLTLQQVKKDALDRELLINVARASLRTKVQQELADSLTEIVVDAVLTIRREGQPIDLFMVEIMTMQHRTESETRLVKGLVLDHGSRHPDMPKRLENAFILTCNVSLEFEKTYVLLALSCDFPSLMISTGRSTQSKCTRIANRDHAWLTLSTVW